MGGLWGQWSRLSIHCIPAEMKDSCPRRLVGGRTAGSRRLGSLSRATEKPSVDCATRSRRRKLRDEEGRPRSEHQCRTARPCPRSQGLLGRDCPSRDEVWGREGPVVHCCYCRTVGVWGRPSLEGLAPLESSYWLLGRGDRAIS